jgi:alcohol dehydrogenase (cytochrome c)
LTYGKYYLGWRYSELTEINARTVSHLAPRWIYQSGFVGANETTPLVVGGMMFVTGPSNNAAALDLLTGKQIWRYQKATPSGLDLCCGQPNRGFAVLGDKLFKANIEASW